jgi:hypothetical protein
MSDIGFSRPEDAVSRREFLVRLGITGALIAGSGLAARKLWQPEHFVPGFEKETGLVLRSYAPESSKVLPSLAIAHGRNTKRPSAPRSPRSGAWSGSSKKATWW